MEMLSKAALSYCHLGKNEGAACRSLLTLCKWLLADWKDMTPQLKQVYCFLEYLVMIITYAKSCAQRESSTVKLIEHKNIKCKNRTNDGT